jgi:hypothetical protein
MDGRSHGAIRRAFLAVEVRGGARWPVDVLVSPAPVMPSNWLASVGSKISLPRRYRSTTWAGGSTIRISCTPWRKWKPNLA